MDVGSSSEMPDNDVCPGKDNIDEISTPSSNTIDTSETCDSSSFNITELPSEILLHICSFLHAKVVIRTLSRVCQTFHSLVSDNTFWKLRIRKKSPKKYPAISVDDEIFDWKEACIEREEKHRLWSRYSENMDYFHYTSGLFAPVDAVHLMKNGTLMATGSRDRYFHLVKLDQLESGKSESINNAERHVEMNAHQGWIWSINSLDNTVCTASWDTKIKFWDVNSNCTLTDTVKLKSAVLCTHYEHGFLAAGSYDKKVYHIDPRTASIVGTKRYHQQPVLCLSASDRYILTGSEDKTFKVFDRRGDSVVKTIEMESYAMSMSYRGDDQLWIGQKNGCLTLVDASVNGDFSVVQTYDVGHTGKITGVIHTLGALFTCSTDKTVKVLEPTADPGVIATLDQQTAEVASIHLQNEILAQANSSISVGVWKPKS